MIGITIHQEGALVSTKTILLLRHGQTDSNLTRAIQGPDEPLNDTGRAQARLLAARLAKSKTQHPITRVISSNFARAMETAEMVSNTLDVPIVPSPLFVECLHPSRIWGRPIEDPEALRTITAFRDNFFDLAFTYEDGETFLQRKARALRALLYILQFDDECIAVVTHGVFGTFLVNAALFGEALTPLLIDKLSMMSTNTGIITLQYGLHHGFTGPRTDWRLHVGDAAHLE